MDPHDPAAELGRAVTLVPEPADVFADPVGKHLEHLQPLASVDLGQLGGPLDGLLHVVSPLEPCDGYPGDATEMHHNEYVGPNWMAFKVVDGRYRFLGDFRYFFLENGEELAESYPDQRTQTEAHCAVQRSSYEESKAAFLKDGWKKASPITRLGGRAMWGNWSAHPPPPKHFSVTEDPAASEASVWTADGRELTFVASVESWRFRRGGADTLLFYDAEEQVALLTFDWT